MDFAQYPITLLIIIANVIFSFIGFSNESLLSKTIGWPYYEKRDKQYYRMITSGFLHADWMHLIFNMFTFFFFGSALELYLSADGLGGSISFLMLYFFGLIAANIPGYIKHNNDENYRSLGASGAVSAVVFGCIIFSPWSELNLYGEFKLSMVLYAILYIVFCIYMEKRKADNINHDAHLWGGIFGLAFTFALISFKRPDCFPFIIEDLKNVHLFGTNTLSSLLKHLGFHKLP
jgi:membrane associated rhomboid family serine protease